MSTIEYALLASLIAIAIIVAVYALQGSVSDMYDNVAQHVTPR